MLTDYFAARLICGEPDLAEREVRVLIDVVRPPHHVAILVQVEVGLCGDSGVIG